MAGEAFTICPDVYTYADREHNKLTIEAEVPGVGAKWRPLDMGIGA